MINDETAQRLANAQEKLISILDKESVLEKTASLPNNRSIMSFEKRCQEVWVRAWTATAGSSNCSLIGSPSRWADRCVLDFKERFEKDE